MQQRISLRALFRHAENGSADAGSFGDTIYLPLLFVLLLFGFIVAMVGFWRVGASYATQYGAQVGAISPEVGDSVVAEQWSGWTGGNAPTDAFWVAPDGRSVGASIDTSATFDSFFLGPMDFSISAGSDMHVRAERFYPGPDAEDQ
ncbi:MAG: hypothetical protein M1546_14855 [Chloroflexi bacterium]|nr:hypothetical protein [Chloroflexota bacterium]